MSELTQSSYLATRDVVSNLLHEYCLGKIEKAAGYDRSYEKLWQEVDMYIQGGGKRMRAYLVLLTYQAYGGRSLEDAMPVAASWELLHASLLIHDDIIDRDFVRHGKPNVAGAYSDIYNAAGLGDANHFASSAAMIAGDLLLSGSYELLHSAKVDVDRKMMLSQLLSDALFGVAGGELMDMEIVLQSIPSADTLRIAQYKTAEYTCEYPILCGAVLVGVNDSEKQLLRKMALAMGIGFQLIDDILGVFGEEKITGKSITGDIREKKRTILLQKTYQLLGVKQKHQLEIIMDKKGELLQSDITTVKDLIDKSGARQAVLSQISEYRKEALGIIDSLSIADDYKEQYRWVIEKLLDRKF